MSELTLEQALILLDESRQHNAAMLNRLYESLGIDSSDGEIRFKWAMIAIEDVKSERDAALAQNADLVAQVAQLELNTESLMSIIKSKAAAHINMNVAEIQGEALLAAASYLSESIPDNSHESVIFKDGYVYISTRYLRDYAERVKAGEV